MNIQELQTLVNYNVGIKTFILDNRCYGITKQFQARKYGERFEACGPVGYNPPDFSKIVQAYGIHTFSLSRSVDTTKIIEAVMSFTGPAVCIVECPDFHEYAPRIEGWGSGIEEQTPTLPEEDFLANMLISPLEGWRERRK